MHGALPDLILTDLKMPNMSGFEFLSVVRRRFPQIPAIAISGEFQPAVESSGVLADAFFLKPLAFERLLAKVRELLRDAPPRPAIKKDRAPVWVPRNYELYEQRGREDGHDMDDWLRADREHPADSSGTKSRT